jgi:hypothetical protein
MAAPSHGGGAHRKPVRVAHPTRPWSIADPAQRHHPGQVIEGAVLMEHLAQGYLSALSGRGLGATIKPDRLLQHVPNYRKVGFLQRR